MSLLCRLRRSVAVRVAFFTLLIGLIPVLAYKSADLADAFMGSTADSPQSASPQTTPLNAVTTLDAIVLARHILALSPLPSPAPEKYAASDTSGNCSITSLDPSQIAGWVTDNTAGGTTNTTINPPGPCANFPISFPVLKGDVTGTAPVTTIGSGSATVSLPHITPSPGLIVVPIMVSDLTGTDAMSFDMQINFDPVILEPASPFVSSSGTFEPFRHREHGE